MDRLRANDWRRDERIPDVAVPRGESRKIATVPLMREGVAAARGFVEAKAFAPPGAKRGTVESRSPRSPRTEPAQSLVGRVVVNAKPLGDLADADAAGVHRAADGCDDLINRDNERVSKTNVTDKTTEGSESFSPRPPLLASVAVHTHCGGRGTKRRAPADTVNSSRRPVNKATWRPDQQPDHPDGSPR